MQYKCMEKEIKKLHGGFYVPICHVCREYSGRNAALAVGNYRIPVYRLLIFPPAPLAPGKRNGFCRFVKNMITHRKSTDTIPCSMSPHSRTTSSRRLQDFPVCSALAPDSERPAILSGRDLYPCFCAVFFTSKKGL